MKKLLITGLVLVGGSLGAVVFLNAKSEEPQKLPVLSSVVAKGDLRETVSGTGTVTLLSTKTSDQLTVDITEYDVDVLKIGQSAAISIPGTGQKVTGKIWKIAKEATEKDGTRSYSVTLKVTALPKQVRNGMSVSADIITRTLPGVIVVPSSAITKDDNGTAKVSVLSADGFKQTERVVKLGVMMNSQVQVISGLAVGERVVTGQDGKMPKVPGYMGGSNASGSENE